MWGKPEWLLEKPLSPYPAPFPAGRGQKSHLCLQLGWSVSAHSEALLGSRAQAQVGDSRPTCPVWKERWASREDLAAPFLWGLFSLGHFSVENEPPSSVYSVEMSREPRAASPSLARLEAWLGPVHAGAQCMLEPLPQGQACLPCSRGGHWRLGGHVCLTLGLFSPS